MTIAVLITLVVIGILFKSKFDTIMAGIEEGKNFRMPPEAVTTVTVKEDSWQPVLGAVGSLTAVNGVMVSADLPGIVESINFESGKAVKKGDLLVQLDTRQEKAQLQAAVAKRELAILNLNRQQGLISKRVSAQSEFDAAAAEYRQQDANVHEIEATIARKTIRSPFDGLLGIRLVNVGQYVQAGEKIVPLQSMDPIYVDFALPQQHLAELVEGKPVQVFAEGLGTTEFPGAITAVNSMVDSTTRNVQVQATLKNPEALLRPGMFVKVDVVLPTKDKVVAVPASAISYAPYGDSVYVVEDGKDPDGKATKIVKQQFVKLGSARGDQVAVTGVDPGREVVTSGVFKLRPDAEINIKNDVQPGNESNPHPAES